MLRDNQTILGQEVANNAINKINKTKEKGGNNNEEEKTTKRNRNNTK